MGRETTILPSPRVPTVLNELHKLSPQARLEFEQWYRHIEDHGPHNAGAVAVFDCLVDGSLSADVPLPSDAPAYRTPTLALNDFAANGRTRCFALIRPGYTYDDTARALSPGSLNNVWLFCQKGAFGDLSAIPATRWLILGAGAGHAVSINHLRIDNLRCEFATGGSAQISGTGLRLDGVSVTGSNTAVTVSATYGVAIDSSFYTSGANMVITGGTKFTLLGCEVGASAGQIRLTGEELDASFTYQLSRFTVIGSMLIDPVTGRINARMKSVIRGVGGSSGVCGMTLSPTGQLDVVVDAYTGFAPNINVTSGYVTLRGLAEDLVATGGELYFTGRCKSLTASGTSMGSFQGRFDHFLDFDSDPWVVDAIRGAAYAATEALRLRAGCVQSNFRIGGTNMGGGEKPFTIDAGSNLHFVDFAGASTYPAVGTDAGAGNVVRQT